MPEIGLFKAIGPWMVGPSSSHTAGVCSIALIARRLFGHAPVRADFTLYGSFAETWRGHGTDKALLGGALGFETWDPRIRHSAELAKKAGLAYTFTIDKTTPVPHPNTADVRLSDAQGNTLTVRGVSMGGGKIKIVQMDGVDVDFTGEFPTLIVVHHDAPGALSFITRVLEDHSLNIAAMRCYRESKGGRAFAVLESDGHIEKGVLDDLSQSPLVMATRLLQY